MDAATLNILIDIRARLDELARARGEIQRTKQEAQGFGELLRAGLGIGTGMELASRAIQSVRSVINSTVREAFAMADRLKDNAENLRMTTDAYQVLGVVVKEAGGSMELLNQLIAHNNRSLAEARNIGGPAAAAYRELGLAPAELEGMAVERRLEAIGRAIVNHRDQTVAYGAAAQIVGTRNLPMLIGALRELAKGYDAAEDAARRAGQVMDEQTIARLDKAKKKWEEFWNSVVIGTGGAVGELNKWLERSQAVLQAGIGNAGPLAKLLADENKPKSDDELERQRKADADAAAAKQARELTVAEAELALVKAAAFAQEVEQDPFISSQAERRRKLIDALKAESNARWALIEAVKAMPLENETAQQREARLVKMSAEARAVDQRRLNAETGGDSFMQRVRDAFTNRNDTSNALTPGDGVMAGFMQWATQMGSVGQQIAGTITGTIGGAVNTLSNGIVGLITKTKTLGDVGREMGIMFVQALVQMIVQALAFAAVIAIMNAIVPGSGTAAAAVMSRRASGGPVSAGQPYIVGENRPEVFEPTVPGRIWPSVESFRMARGGRSGGATTLAPGDSSRMVGPPRRQRDLWVVGDLFTARRLARDPSWDSTVHDSVHRQRGDLLG